MRALRLAAAILAALTTFLLAPPVGAATSSPFSITDVSAPAGSDELFTVTRAAGGNGIYVLFATSDGTAHAGSDYTAVKQLLYFKANQVTATVAVHTGVNPSATGTLTFTASIAASKVPARATGSIVEPAPPSPPVPVASVPLAAGGYAKAIAAEQAVPKESPYSYGEAVYRTVQAGETVRLGASFPDCACTPREWAVSGLDGHFIGYLWEANLSGVAPAP